MIIDTIKLWPRNPETGAAEIPGSETLGTSAPGAGIPGKGHPQAEEIIERGEAGPGVPDRAIVGVTDPDITAHLPERNAAGCGVVVVPGGGYERVVIDKEGHEIARRLCGAGIAAFVLKYRLPRPYPHPWFTAPIQDAQRALRIVRARHREFGLRADRIGVIGFSAGGHAAGLVSVDPDRMLYPAVDSIDEFSARPDFSALIYSVLSFRDPIAHAGTRKAMLGPDAGGDLERDFSCVRFVGPGTPPAFLCHAADDGAVSVRNSIEYHSALVDSGVYTGLYVFPEGGHGFALRFDRPDREPLAVWPSLFESWIAGFVRRSEADA